VRFLVQVWRPPSDAALWEFVFREVLLLLLNRNVVILFCV
jgi:hypothetical protein